MLYAALQIREQELVSLATIKTIARAVTPESGLVQVGTLITPTRVALMPKPDQITETSTLKSWDTY